jgi:hypothetical protein
MVAGASPSPSGWRLRCRAMHGARSRRVVGFVAGCVGVMSVAACHVGGAATSGSSGNGSGTRAVDMKSACAALAGLSRPDAALKAVNLADPDSSSAALDGAVAAYSAALSTFEQVGPTDLRAAAASMRADVIAHHFGQAAAQRAAISVWAEKNCGS